MTGAQRGPRGPAGTITYCVIPSDLAPLLHQSLRNYYSADAEIEVVVERRTDERRVPRAPRLPVSSERRTRERRTTEPAPAAHRLPAEALPHAHRLVFVTVPAPPAALEDSDTARLVPALIAREPAAIATVYLRYFDRLYAYLLVVLADHHEAEDATQEVFARALQALPRYEERGVPLRGWLFTIARNVAIGRLRRQGLVRLEPPQAIEVRVESGQREPDLSALEWLSDRQIVVLVERLPPRQREVLVLRFLLDLTHDEIAAALDITPEAARQALRRALAFLGERIRALGRGPERRRRHPSLARIRPLPVLRGRRFALWRTLR